MRAWAAQIAAAVPAVRRVGLFGSYARGDWGVGSDVDVVVILDATDVPFERRGLLFDATSLPVPADVLVYTAEEWERLAAEPGFVRSAADEALWVFDR